MNELFSDIFSIANLPGHLSYVLIALSYWLTRMFYLRVVAVVGLALEIVYFSMSGGDLRIGVAWSCLFIVINLYQLYWLIRDGMLSRLPDAYRDVLRSSMEGLAEHEVAQLLRVGHFTCIPDGVTLSVENEPLERLFFICSGQVTVVVGEREAATLGGGSFVGEAAFITGKPATATVKARGLVNALVFQHCELSEFFLRRERLSGIFYQLLGRDLARKMMASNRVLASARVPEHAT